MKGLTEDIKNQADDIKHITIDEAKQLPQMLGVLCPAQLQRNGWYSCTLSGRKQLYILKESV